MSGTVRQAPCIAELIRRTSSIPDCWDTIAKLASPSPKSLWLWHLAEVVVGEGVSSECVGCEGLPLDEFGFARAHARAQLLWCSFRLRLSCVRDQARQARD